MRETEHDATFETSAINFKDKFVYNSIQWSGIYLQVYILPCLGSFHVYMI